MTNDAPQKDTRDMVDVFIEKLAGADRVVLETKNALGEMDAHYLYAPDILEAFDTRADHAQAELQAAVAAERIACANMAYEYLTHSSNPMREELAEMIYVRTEADAQAALEAAKRETRNEALREAFNILRTYAPDQVDGPEHDVGYASGYATAQNRLLALMEDQSDG